jgi:hypothetical protein
MFLELLYTEMAPSSTKRSEVEIELVFWLLRVNTPDPLTTSFHRWLPLTNA